MGLIKSNLAPPTMRAFSLADIEKQAQGILLRAQQQAEQFLAAAQEEAEQLKRQGYAEGLQAGKVEGLAKGYEDGKKAGHTEALNGHREKLGQLVQALGDSMTQLDTQRQDLQSTALREVVELASAIARRVTKRQSMIDPAVLIANLTEAMKLVLQSVEVRIAVHPQQRQTLEAELPNLKLRRPSLKHVELIDEPGLSPGGCRIYSLHGQVDAEIDGQLERVIEELLPHT